MIEIRKIIVLWLLDLALRTAPGVEHKGVLAKHLRGYYYERITNFS